MALVLVGLHSVVQCRDLSVVYIDQMRQYEALDLLRWSYYLVWWLVLLLLCFAVVIQPGVVAGAAGLVGDPW